MSGDSVTWRLGRRRRQGPLRRAGTPLLHAAAPPAARPQLGARRLRELLRRAALRPPPPRHRATWTLPASGSRAARPRTARLRAPPDCPGLSRTTRISPLLSPSPDRHRGGTDDAPPSPSLSRRNSSHEAPRPAPRSACQPLPAPLIIRVTSCRPARTRAGQPWVRGCRGRGRRQAASAAPAAIRV